MFQKKFSLLIKKCTHFIWQEKYFCLQREEGHTGNCTTQERNGLRQNYSSSVNFSPSLKPRHSCPILDFLVTPAFHNFPQELQSEPSALTQTPCANQGQFWWILGFFSPHFRRNSLQFANLIFRVTLNATSLEFFTWDQKTFYHECFADDQNCCEVSERRSKQLSTWLYCQSLESVVAIFTMEYVSIHEKSLESTRIITKVAFEKF